jgi:hypothetical protein
MTMPDLEDMEITEPGLISEEIEELLEQEGA